MEKKKVYYSVVRSGRKFSRQFKGYGYITETDLVGVWTDKQGNEHQRVFKDCIRHCKQNPNYPNQFYAHYYEIEEIEVENHHRYDTNYSYYDTIEIEVDYKIYFKLI